MTDSTPPTEHDDADLLASLYLDGEATPAEMDQVERDPSLLERVEHFRALAGAVGEPLRPPVGLAQRHIGEALAAFDALAPVAAAAAGRTPAQPTPPPTEEAAPVISLAERRTSKGLPAWLGAAAAALVVVGGVGFAITNLSSSQDDSADAATADFEAQVPSASATELRANDGDDRARSVDDDALADSDAADSDLAADEAVTAESGAGEAEEAAEDAGAADAGAAAEESEALTEPSTTTTYADDSAALVNVGSLDGRTAIELFETYQPTLAMIEEASCFGSPAEGAIDAIIGYSPMIVDGELVELIVFATSDTAADDEVAAVVLSAVCEPILS